MRKNGINVGTSSILMIFVLLCLTAFATLSMASANADYKLAQRAARSVSLYYEADARAQAMLARIEDMLIKAADLPDDAYTELFASDALYEKDGGSIQLRTETEDTAVWIAYQIPIDDNRTLSVSLEAPRPYTDGSAYKITAWQVLFTGEWEADEGIDVWGGSSPDTQK